MKPFKAIILAAGKGTRLKSDTPKVLHRLFGQALLERVLKTLQELPIQEAYLVVGHGREKVQESLETWNLSVPIISVLQEPQRGTGHAALQVKEVLPSSYEGDVLIAYGDVPLVTHSTYEKLIRTHQQSQHDLTVLVATLEEPSCYGRVVMNRNQLTKIVEERDASPEEKAIKTVNTGIYCLSWNKIAPLLDKLSANNAQGELYLTDVIEIANQQGLRVGCVSLQDPNEMLGVNARTDLALCHKILNERSQQALMDAGVTIINPEQTMVAPEVSVGADTVIYPGCFLQGNITIGERCTLGPNTTLMGQVSIGDDSSVISSLIKDSMVGSRSTVGPFAHLRDGTYLSDHVRIGNFVEVKNTRIDHHTNAAHLAYLGDAVIGTGVNMGAGSITANYDPVRNEKHQTIIEDGVKVGCNAVLVAPVTIAHDSCVAAGSVITKNVEPWDLAIARPKQTQIPQWVAKIQRETTPTKS